MNEAVKEYQCCGCVSGEECYQKGLGIECNKHVPGTRGFRNREDITWTT